MSGVDLGGAWGLADDLLERLQDNVRETKYLLAAVGNEVVAIPDVQILEVVDRPRVSRWLTDPLVVGTFALRGDIYTLTDPLESGTVREVAVVLYHGDRYVAIACDRMVGVETIADQDWEEFESPRFDWARRVWLGTDPAAVLLEPDSYLSALASGRKESDA